MSTLWKGMNNLKLVYTFFVLLYLIKASILLQMYKHIGKPTFFSSMQSSYSFYFFSSKIYFIWDSEIPNPLSLTSNMIYSLSGLSIGAPICYHFNWESNTNISHAFNFFRVIIICPSFVCLSALLTILFITLLTVN